MLSPTRFGGVSCVHEDGRCQVRQPRTSFHGEQPCTHFTAEVRDWLADNPKITLHRAPVGASWINQIEIWFGLITRQAIRRGTFSSVKQLVTTIKNYIADWNADCKPFRMTVRSRCRPKCSAASAVMWEVVLLARTTRCGTAAEGLCPAVTFHVDRDHARHHLTQHPELHGTVLGHQDAIRDSLPVLQLAPD
jgi:hypothetical protein